MSKSDKQKGFRVQIGDEGLNFKARRFHDPVVLGRQMIEATGAKPVDEHAVVAILNNGDFEDIRLDEPYNLSARGAEKVLVFRTDRSFKFKIDDRDLEWPRACISGFVLKKIAALPVGHTLWLEIRGGQDREIADHDLIRLDEPGVEKFFSLQAEQICIFINSRQKLVDPGTLSFSELVKLAFPGALPGPNTAYTVSFYKGPGDDPEGTLVKGESANLKKGMVFNVSETDKS